MDEDWWIRIQRPDGEVHLYHLSFVDWDTYEALLHEAMADQGCPEDWIDLRPEQAWDVVSMTGDPHPSQLAIAVLHDWTDR